MTILTEEISNLFNKISNIINKTLLLFEMKSIIRIHWTSFLDRFTFCDLKQSIPCKSLNIIYLLIFFSKIIIYIQTLYNFIK